MVTPDNDWLVYDEQLPLVREYCANPRGWIRIIVEFVYGIRSALMQSLP